MVTVSSTQSWIEAYSHRSFPEFYDLWTTHTERSAPREDIPIFTRILNNLLDSHNPSHQSGFAINDLGTGTGRVLYALLDALQARYENPNATAELISTAPEPMYFGGEDINGPVVDLAEEKFYAKYNTKWGYTYFADGNVMVGVGMCCGDAVEVMKGMDHGTDLITFAAGGVHHILEEKEVKRFLGFLWYALGTGKARAVVSMLRELVVDGDHDGSGLVAAVVSDQETLRLEDGDGEQKKVFVKFPTVSTWEGDIRTDQFRLEVQDVGSGTKTLQLGWQLKVVHTKLWEESLIAAGLVTDEKIVGDRQIFWVLKRS